MPLIDLGALTRFANQNQIRLKFAASPHDIRVEQSVFMYHFSVIMTLRLTMKEQDWDDSLEAPQQGLDETQLLLDDSDSEIKTKPNPTKQQLTELRRRMEDRIEQKRISLEFDYEEMENWSDTIQ
ncbi:MAG: hypothetical protein AB8B95_02195 [Pseudohongiellaceae bacterium]